MVPSPTQPNIVVMFMNTCDKDSRFKRARKQKKVLQVMKQLKSSGLSGLLSCYLALPKIDCTVLSILHIFSALHLKIGILPIIHIIIALSNSWN